MLELMCFTSAIAYSAIWLLLTGTLMKWNEMIHGAELHWSCMFEESANLVFKVGLDGDLHAVCDTFAVFPHVVNQQVAQRCHVVANWEL